MTKLVKVLPEHEQIIDQYFVNGFNGTLAVKQIRPELSDNVASATFSRLMNNPGAQEYLKEKQARLKALTEIRTEAILREIINFAYSDASTFIGLTPEEIKELPIEVRRCIASFKTKDHYDKHGSHIGTTTEVKLVDKLKAIEMINKHIGFYSEDNKQKQVKINLNKIDANTLNVFLQALEDGEQQE